REVEEHQFFNIGGILLPLSEIFLRKDEIPTNGKVIVYCKRGIRSQIAIQRLTSLFPNCEFYNLANGVWDIMPH
ncbi:MAG: rhodanese-like domain-containing protein, partial [Saprospiraceae bacterium]